MFEIFCAIFICNTGGRWCGCLRAHVDGVVSGRAGVGGCPRPAQEEHPTEGVLLLSSFFLLALSLSFVSMYACVSYNWSPSILSSCLAHSFDCLIFPQYSAVRSVILPHLTSINESITRVQAHITTGIAALTTVCSSFNLCTIYFLISSSSISSFQ
jgi:hypothetical protein